MSLLSDFFGYLQSFWVDAEEKNIIDEELLEEYRMLSGFDEKEIYRVQHAFYEYSNGEKYLTMDAFGSIEWVEVNPLKDRLRSIFGFDDANKIDFRKFLEIVAAFNCTAFGRREIKLRIAFRLQDMDGDGVITKADLISYLERTTAMELSAEDIGAVADNILKECSTDAKGEKITFTDFQRVVAPTDFHTRLRLPI